MIPTDLKEYIGSFHAEWLYTQLYQNRFFFLDFWSFNHFGSGFFLMLILQRFAPKHKWLLTLAVLIFYETAEILFVYFSLDIFHPETLKDQITDLGVGMAGACLAAVLANRQFITRYVRNDFKRLADVFAAVTTAYFFTGFYHYHLEPKYFNTGPFNFPAFGWWIILSLLAIVIYRNLLLKKFPKWRIITCLLIVYPACSFLLLNLSGSLAGIHDTAISHQMMLFSIGDWVFPLAFVWPPFLLMVCVWAAQAIFRGALRNAPVCGPGVDKIIISLLIFVILIWIGYLFNQSLAGRQSPVAYPSASSTPPAELMPGDLIVRTNNKWIPGSAGLPQGRYVGHVAIVMNHVKNGNFDSLFHKAIVIESVVYDQQQNHYLHNKSQQLRYVYASRSFGEKYKGCRYILHLSLTTAQREKITRQVQETKNPGYSFFSLKDSQSAFGNLVRSAFPFTARYNCALLVWEVYMKALSFDLDANGGLFVFPNDLIMSPYFDSQGSRYRF